MRWIFDWLNRRTNKDQLAYAGSQYALALAAGDTRRAARIKKIINTLEESSDDH